jgi:hypothetical protein
MKLTPVIVGQPTISFSRASYLKVEARLREEAKSQRTLLVTQRGIEDYRNGEMVFRDGGIAEARQICREQQAADVL